MYNYTSYAIFHPVIKNKPKAKTTKEDILKVKYLRYVLLPTNLSRIRGNLKNNFISKTIMNEFLFACLPPPHLRAPHLCNLDPLARSRDCGVGGSAAPSPW
jgi:hypothetical protein